jgi:predicted transcriptional regulator
MWHLDNESMVTSKCRLPRELNDRLGKAAVVFGAPEEEIIAQALREFFEKHGIRDSKTTEA